MRTPSARGGDPTDYSRQSCTSISSSATPNRAFGSAGNRGPVSGSGSTRLTHRHHPSANHRRVRKPASPRLAPGRRPEGTHRGAGGVEAWQADGRIGATFQMMDPEAGRRCLEPGAPWLPEALDVARGDPSCAAPAFGARAAIDRVVWDLSRVNMVDGVLSDF